MERLLSPEWWDVQMHLLVEHAVHHTLTVGMLSMMGFCMGMLAYAWKQSKYGMRVVARICMIEDDRLFFDEVLTGDAIAMTGSKDVAGTLVKAAKKAPIGTLIGERQWKDAVEAARGIRRLHEQVSVEFASGVLARANNPENAERQTYIVGAFRRANTISVIFIRQDQLREFSPRVIGEGPELTEIGILQKQIDSRWFGKTDLCM